MALRDFKDLKKRTATDKVLRDKAFNIAKNLKYDGYQRGLASMVYKFFDKKTKGSGYTPKYTAKGYTPNLSKEVFVIKRIENTVPWTYVIDDLNGEEITGTFYENELQQIDQQEFRIEKVIKKKGDKLYVKWKGNDNSFNSWIDKKDSV